MNRNEHKNQYNTGNDSLMEQRIFHVCSKEDKNIRYITQF